MDDPFAWRAWVGFDYLTYSDGWRFLMEWCDPGTTPASWMPWRPLPPAPRRSDTSRAERLAERYEAGRAMIAAHAWTPRTQPAGGPRRRLAARLRSAPRRWPATRTPRPCTPWFARRQFFPTQAKAAVHRLLSSCAAAATAPIHHRLRGRLHVPPRRLRVVSRRHSRPRAGCRSPARLPPASSKTTDALMFSTFSRARSGWPSARRSGGPRCGGTAGASPPLRPTASLEEASAATPITLAARPSSPTRASTKGHGSPSTPTNPLKKAPQPGLFLFILPLTAGRYPSIA